MLRISVVALILTAAAAASTAAAEGTPVAPAVPQQLALVGTAELVPAGAAVVVQHAAWRARGFQRQEQVDARSARLMPERRRQPGLVLPWRSQGRSAVALRLTDRLALGVGYDWIEGEDLWREFAEIGATDYESHNVLLRAHWRF